MRMVLKNGKSLSMYSHMIWHYIYCTFRAFWSEQFTISDENAPTSIHLVSLFVIFRFTIAQRIGLNLIYMNALPLQKWAFCQYAADYVVDLF